MGEAVMNLGFLEALEAAAPTPDAGRQAWLTWSLVQAFGWDEARRRVPRSTWYRHLGLLEAAGLPVPSGRDKSVFTPSASGSGWFGASSHEEAAAILSASPGRIMELMNQRFHIVAPDETGKDKTQPRAARLRLVCSSYPWANLGADCGNGRYELQAWEAGTEGVVTSVVFEGRWRIELEHDDYTLQQEERWPRVDLSEFIRCTWPLGEVPA